MLNEPLIVHETHRPPAPILRYIDQIVGVSTPELAVRYSQGILRRLDVDVVHVADEHLDLLLGVEETRAFRRLLSIVVLATLVRSRRIALVRTLHPTEEPPVARGLAVVARRLLDKATCMFIAFDDSTPTPDARRTTVIPHAHFQDRFVGYPRREQLEGRVLCIAHSWLPPEVHALRATVRDARTVNLTLRVAGLMPDEFDNIPIDVAADPTIVSERLALLSDGAQVQEITAAELVVAPRIDSLERLQGIFIALSLNRPVLTPRTETTSRLAEQVGPGWLLLCDGPITPDALDAAFTAMRSGHRSASPNLQGRDLLTIRAAYVEAFRAAAESRRRQ